jgi:salicylate hydroxylase
MKIAIIGGGIGGLATARSLLKHGFNVQVYERAQALRPIGAGLTLTVRVKLNKSSFAHS